MDYRLNTQELKRLRVERGFRQVDLALKVGVATTTVARWERGATVPEPNHLGLLAAALAVHPHELTIWEVAHAAGE